MLGFNGIGVDQITKPSRHPSLLSISFIFCFRSYASLKRRVTCARHSDFGPRVGIDSTRQTWRLDAQDFFYALPRLGERVEAVGI
jgi:hypothetical protein